MKSGTNYPGNTTTIFMPFAKLFAAQKMRQGMRL